jgi:hypothetical protein
MRKLLCVGLLAVTPIVLFGQGFGQGIAKTKKSLVLERKLPAAATLKGSAFNVKATAERPQDNCQKLAADKLQSLVETDLIRFNSQLQLNPDAPDTVITLKVLNCNAQATPEYATSLGGSNKSQHQQTGTKVTGDLSITYQARTRAGGFIDAQPIEVKYNQEFNQVSSAIAETKKIIGKIPHPGAKHRQEDSEDEPHTFEDVLQILVNRSAQHVAARLVTTDERVEVLLARGKLDENNRYAEAGQWTRFVENLETMPPLPTIADDSYRLYNIGVGDEALGYKAETPASAKRYFEQAVIQYRKAGEANPDERYFIEPVNRIEIALEHYRKMAAPPVPPAPTPAKTTPDKKGKGK